MLTTGLEIGCLVVGCLLVELVRRWCVEKEDTLFQGTTTMCDTASIQIAEEIIREKVDARAMFTAFDVSREAHQRGSPERHRHLKQVIHAAFDRGDMGTDYDRTLVRLPGVKRPAWLYHRKQDDPNTYAALGGTAVPRGGRSVDGRLRLCVPARPLKQAGLAAGDSVWVTADGQQQCVVLTKTKPGTAVLTTYQVERSGNIRIAQRVLRRAGIAGRAFAIDGDGTTIRVRPT